MMDSMTLVITDHSTSWAAVPWTADLVESMPESATWPRIMSDPHPRAVGSYGAEFIDWWREHPWDVRYLEPRWWQELAAARILEHDAAGRLVWPVWLLTLARQQGKGILLQGLALWRMEFGPDLFGEPAMVLHVASKVKVSREIQRPARSYARAHRAEGWVARDMTGAEEVVHPNESRWLCCSPRSAFGFSASLAFADEAWEIEAELIESGVEPTMFERSSPQLGIISTANLRCSSLFPDRRRAALNDDPGVLLIEWSAPPEMTEDDRRGWRMASPHWTDQREDMLERSLAAARAQPNLLPGSPDPVMTWRSQAMNQWPEKVTGPGPEAPGDELVPADTWAAAAGDSDDVEDWTFAIEDHAGLSTVVAAAGKTADDRIFVQAHVTRTRAEAFEWIAANAVGVEVIAGPALVESGEATELERVTAVRVATTKDTKAGLSALRQLAKDGLLLHLPDVDLDSQIAACRVRVTNAGLVVASGARWDAVRAVAWAAAAADAQRTFDPTVG